MKVLAGQEARPRRDLALTAPASVDCVITADPLTELLVISGRLTQWQAIALGRLTFTGACPEIGPSFADLFVFP